MRVGFIFFWCPRLISLEELGIGVYKKLFYTKVRFEIGDYTINLTKNMKFLAFFMEKKYKKHTKKERLYRQKMKIIESWEFFSNEVNHCVLKIELRSLRHQYRVSTMVSNIQTWQVASPIFVHRWTDAFAIDLHAFLYQFPWMFDSKKKKTSIKFIYTEFEKSVKINTIIYLETFECYIHISKSLKQLNHRILRLKNTNHN